MPHTKENHKEPNIQNTLNELIKQRDELDAQIDRKKEELSQERYNKVQTKINSLTAQQKEFMLSLIKHDRTSCDDEHINNGLMNDGRFRCRKCMLIEILRGEHGGCYDFSFDVNITSTEIE